MVGTINPEYFSSDGPDPPPPVAIPAKVEQMLKQFLLDRKTGNVRINVKDGRVLGVHLEEIVVIR